MERTNCDDKAYFRITNELLSFIHVVTLSWHRREVLQICGFVKIQLNPQEGVGGRGGGGYSWEFLVGACRPVLQILTPFQTKICHFLHPFSELASKIHTRFQTSILEIIVSLLRLKDQQRYFLKAILNSCIFSFGIETTNIYIHALPYLENHTRFQTKMGRMCGTKFYTKLYTWLELNIIRTGVEFDFGLTTAR